MDVEIGRVSPTRARRPTRSIVLTTAMPQLLFDIVRDALAGEADLQLVEGPAAPDELAEAVARHEASVVLTGEGTQQAVALCERLTRQRPLVRVIALPRGAHDALTIERRVCVTTLGDLSLAELVAEIRRPSGTSTLPEHP